MCHTEFFYKCSCCGRSVSSFVANIIWRGNEQIFICSYCGYERVMGIVINATAGTTTRLPYIKLIHSNSSDILV